MSASEPPLVLCYHAVSADWPSPLAVTPDELDGQIRRLLGRGYRPLTFSEALAGSSGERVMAVTFDDAFLSVFEHGFPVLRELGVPATVFAPTRKVDVEGAMTWPGVDVWLGGPHEDELRGASWNQLRELVASGWEVGAHTRAHARLTELDDSGLAEELEGSRIDCERELGSGCGAIAYPYGDFDDRVVAAAAAAGYRAGATMVSHAPVRARDRDPLRWPRVGIYRGEPAWRIAFKRRLLQRNPRAWNALRTGRALIAR